MPLIPPGGDEYRQDVPNPSEATWADVLTQVLDGSHVVAGEQVSALVDRSLRPAGMTARILLVDLAQRRLHPLPVDGSPPVAVADTLAGRAYQLGRIVAATKPDELAEGGDRDLAETGVLWVPMLDGTERIGVLRVGLGSEVTDGPGLRRRLWSLAGLIGHIVTIKLGHSVALQRLRAAGLSTASELMWQLMPPKTFASDRVVISALLEPTEQVAGDAYDYAVDHAVEVAVFDGAGHDLLAGLTTTLAVTAIRNARRLDITDLAGQAAHADGILTAHGGPSRFVTAALARLDTDSGRLSYLLAGHPPPLLLRDGHVVKRLDHRPRPPLGVCGPDIPVPVDVVGHEQLEPGDRVLFYSDGVPEARNPDGEFFGEQRLSDLAERAELDQVSAPETLRRLVAAVLDHQRGGLQDDVTLLLVEWAGEGHVRLLPGE